MKTTLKPELQEIIRHELALLNESKKLYEESIKRIRKRILFLEALLAEEPEEVKN